MRSIDATYRSRSNSGGGVAGRSTRQVGHVDPEGVAGEDRAGRASPRAPRDATRARACPGPRARDRRCAIVSPSREWREPGRRGTGAVGRRARASRASPSTRAVLATSRVGSTRCGAPRSCTHTRRAREALERAARRRPRDPGGCASGRCARARRAPIPSSRGAASDRPDRRRRAGLDQGRFVGSEEVGGVELALRPP